MLAFLRSFSPVWVFFISLADHFVLLNKDNYKEEQEVEQRTW